MEQTMKDMEYKIYDIIRAIEHYMKPNSELAPHDQEYRDFLLEQIDLIESKKKEYMEYIIQDY